MTLAAAQVVDYVAQTLRTAGTAAGTRVYTSRFWPLSEDELPAIRVTAEQEDILQVGAGSPWELQHDLQVDVQCSVRQTADADDAMHSLAEEVLAALFAPGAITAQNSLRVQLSPIAITRDATTDGEAAVGQITPQFLARFHTRVDAPGTLI